jgi:hypothetical protein
MKLSAGDEFTNGMFMSTSANMDAALRFAYDISLPWLTSREYYYGSYRRGPICLVKILPQEGSRTYGIDCKRIIPLFESEENDDVWDKSEQEFLVNRNHTFRVVDVSDYSMNEFRHFLHETERITNS